MKILTFIIKTLILLTIGLMFKCIIRKQDKHKQTYREEKVYLKCWMNCELPTPEGMSFEH